MSDRTLKWLSYLPAALVAAGIAVVSLIETNHIPAVAVNDKLIHALMYAVLAMTLMIPYLSGRITHWSLYLNAWVIASLYGALMEWLQPICTQTRVTDYADALANMVGAIIGLLVLALCRYIWRHIHTT